MSLPFENEKIIISEIGEDFVLHNQYNDILTTIPKSNTNAKKVAMILAIWPQTIKTLENYVLGLNEEGEGQDFFRETERKFYHLGS